MTFSVSRLKAYAPISKSYFVPIRFGNGVESDGDDKPSPSLPTTPPLPDKLIKTNVKKNVSKKPSSRAQQRVHALEVQVATVINESRKLPAVLKILYGISRSPLYKQPPEQTVKNIAQFIEVTHQFVKEQKKKNPWILNSKTNQSILIAPTREYDFSTPSGTKAFHNWRLAKSAQYYDNLFEELNGIEQQQHNAVMTYIRRLLEQLPIPLNHPGFKYEGNNPRLYRAYIIDHAYMIGNPGDEKPLSVQMAVLRSPYFYLDHFREAHQALTKLAKTSYLEAAIKKYSNQFQVVLGHPVDIFMLAAQKASDLLQLAESDKYAKALMEQSELVIDFQREHQNEWINLRHQIHEKILPNRPQSHILNRLESKDPTIVWMTLLDLWDELLKSDPKNYADLQALNQTTLFSFSPITVNAEK